MKTTTLQDLRRASEPYDLATRSMMCAIGIHGDQRRKYSDTPYVLHPIRVAHAASTSVDFDSTPSRDVITSIAFLHDTVEDCDINSEELMELIDNAVVVAGVAALTESKVGTRAERMQHMFDNISTAQWHIKVIKACDRIDNLSLQATGEREKFRGFYLKKYLPESERLLEAIRSNWDGFSDEETQVLLALSDTLESIIHDTRTSLEAEQAV